MYGRIEYALQTTTKWANNLTGIVPAGAYAIRPYPDG